MDKPFVKYQLINASPETVFKWLKENREYGDDLFGTNQKQDRFEIEKLLIKKGAQVLFINGTGRASACVA